MSVDTLHINGLDTLSEYRLLRITDKWTGELYPAESADSLSVDGVVSDAIFADMVERWRMSRSIYQNVDAEEVLGNTSSLAPGVYPISDASGQIAADSLMGTPVAESVMATENLSTGFTLSPDIMFNSVVVIIFMAYIYSIYRYYDDVLALIQSAFHRNVIVADRVKERRRSDLFYGFLGKLSVLGLGFIGVFSTIWAIRSGRELFGFTDDQITISPLVGMGLFIIIIMVQYLLLFVAGAITQSMHTTTRMMRMRLTYFVFATVAVAPVLLISQVAIGYNIWYVLAVIIAVLVLILYLRESLDLFVSKKISILHWILYLCTVEIVPLTLLWQIAIRVR